MPPKPTRRRLLTSLCIIYFALISLVGHKCRYNIAKLRIVKPKMAADSWPTVTLAGHFHTLQAISTLKLQPDKSMFIYHRLTVV